MITPSRMTVRRALVAFTASVAVVSVVGISSFLSVTHTSSRRDTVRSAGGTTEVSLFPAVGVSLVPAPSAKPAIDMATAIKAAVEDAIRPDVQSVTRPVATLALMSKNLNAPVGDLVSNEVKDLLVWDVAYPDAPQEIRGPSDAEPAMAPPCDLHVLVNATTGNVLEGFQVGCRG
ncbi:MAG: hypothetical protein JWO76_1999 [Nocardioides sp.]|nr:hypothetical protein [Nocardioides sp.]